MNARVSGEEVRPTNGVGLCGPKCCGGPGWGESAGVCRHGDGSGARVASDGVGLLRLFGDAAVATTTSPTHLTFACDR